MHLSCLLVQCILIFGLPIGKAIGTNELYQYSNANQLEHGLDKFKFLKLDTPIHFFSDTYDHIYVSDLAALCVLKFLLSFVSLKKKL